MANGDRMNEQMDLIFSGVKFNELYVFRII